MLDYFFQFSKPLEPFKQFYGDCYAPEKFKPPHLIKTNLPKKV